jgi:alpha-L-rhamnosidase
MSGIRRQITRLTALLCAAALLMLCGCSLGERKVVMTVNGVAISDDGEHWRHLLTLEDGPISEYSYPAIIQGRDGTVHLIYTWRRERICHAEFQLP